VPAQLEGRVLLGPGREPAPAFVFAARDRMDESSDTVRAARDARFKYVRNLRPDLPYQLPNSFGAEMPTWRELKRLHDAGELTGAAALWFRERRPPEELYDTRADPHEVHDLAGDPRYEAELARLRAALERWLAAAPDLGLLPEAELRERFWPGGEQPVTAAPESVIADGRLTLRSATAGASLGYRVDGGAWQLYTGPFALEPGARIEAKAVRYGWAESESAEASAR
jgi:hypothetical protein